GDRGAHVARRVDVRGQLLDFLRRVARLVNERAGTPAADHEVRLDVGLAHPLQEAHAVDHARRPRHSNDYPARGHSVTLPQLRFREIADYTRNGFRLPASGSWLPGPGYSVFRHEPYRRRPRGGQARGSGARRVPVP